MIELQECIDKLTSDDEADRIWAAEDIGYANQSAGVNPLLARLPAERSRAVRESIFSALSQIDDDAVIVGTMQLLDSDDSFLRNQAVELLRARGARAVPFLDRAFRDGDKHRRKFVIDVLAKLGDPAVSAIYDLALRDPDLNIVITAVENLGNTHQAAFRETIENLLSPHVHPMLLCACLEALAQIAGPTSLKAASERLGSLADLPDYLQPAFLKLLGAVGLAEDAVEVAGSLTKQGLEAPVLNALTVLRTRYGAVPLPVDVAQPLREMVTRNHSPLLAYQAVRLLGCLLEDPPVFDFLEQCLAHPEKSVRIGAGQTLRESATAKGDVALNRHVSAEKDEEVLQAWGIKAVNTADVPKGAL